MISTRELKSEIEQLTAQNQQLSEEIRQLKMLLEKQAGHSGRGYSSSNGSNGKHNGGNGHENRQGTGQNGGQSNGQNNGRNGSDQNNQQASGQGQNGQQGQQNQQQPPQISQIANEFLQLKGLTASLETKMGNYMASQTGGNTLKQQDVAYLILNMMNGMIDWTIEYVARGQGNGSSN